MAYISCFFFSSLLRNVYPRIGEKFRGGQIVLYVLLNTRSFIVCPPVVVCGNVRNSRVKLGALIKIVHRDRLEFLFLRFLNYYSSRICVFLRYSFRIKLLLIFVNFQTSHSNEMENALILSPLNISFEGA